MAELLVAPGVAFLKWDMNRTFSEAGWPEAPDPERLWIARGVRLVMDRLRIQHGFTQLYPPGTLEAWVTHSPNTVTGRRTPTTPAGAVPGHADRHRA